jgi:hypothetical protein
MYNMLNEINADSNADSSNSSQKCKESSSYMCAVKLQKLLVHYICSHLLSAMLSAVCLIIEYRGWLFNSADWHTCTKLELLLAASATFEQTVYTRRRFSTKKL